MARQNAVDLPNNTTTFLRGDGTWAEPGGGTSHNIGSATHPDTNITGLDTGDVLAYDGTDWVNIGAGSDGQVFTSTGASSLPGWEDAAGGGTADPWFTPSTGLPTRVDAESFSVTDNATNQNIYQPGRALKYTSTVGGSGYGVVRSYSAGTVYLSGITLGSSGSITSMEYGDRTRSVVMFIFLPGLYESASTVQACRDVLGMYPVYVHSRGYFVGFRAYSRIVDGGTGGYVNVRAASNDLSTLNSGLGLQLSSVAWVNSSVQWDTTYYQIPCNTVLEVKVTKGGTGDAQDLTLALHFVLE